MKIPKKIKDAVSFYNRCSKNILSVDAIGEGPKFILRENGHLVMGSVSVECIYDEVASRKIDHR